MSRRFFSFENRQKGLDQAEYKSTDRCTIARGEDSENCIEFHSRRSFLLNFLYEPPE